MDQGCTVVEPLSADIPVERPIHADVAAMLLRARQSLFDKTSQAEPSQ